jgi:hypothetical protein
MKSPTLKSTLSSTYYFYLLLKDYYYHYFENMIKKKQIKKHFSHVGACGGTPFILYFTINKSISLQKINVKLNENMIKKSKQKSILVMLELVEA